MQICDCLGLFEIDNATQQAGWVDGCTYPLLSLNIQTTVNGITNPDSDDLILEWRRATVANVDVTCERRLIQWIHNVWIFWRYFFRND